LATLATLTFPAMGVEFGCSKNSPGEGARWKLQKLPNSPYRVRVRRGASFKAFLYAPVLEDPSQVEFKTLLGGDETCVNYG